MGTSFENKEPQKHKKQGMVTFEPGNLISKRFDSINYEKSADFYKEEGNGSFRVGSDFMSKEEFMNQYPKEANKVFGTNTQTPTT